MCKEGVTMSVLIKGMKMPNKCSECDFVGNLIMHNGKYICECPSAKTCGKNVTEAARKGIRDLNCPLVEVPKPHGRLIDKDRLKREMLWNFAGEKIPLYDCDNNPVDFHVKDVEATINSQPTVIEPEGEE